MALKITINPELRDYLFGVPVETDEALDQSLKESGGPTNQLVLWKHDGENILIDGNRRYERCAKLGIKLKDSDYRFVELADLGAVKSWMIREQKGRRNWTDAQRNHIIARELERLGKGSKASGGKVKVVAEQFDVSERTVARAKDSAEDQAKLPLDIQEQIKQGKLVPSRRELKALASLPHHEVRRKVAEVEMGSARDLGEALGLKTDTLADNGQSNKKEEKLDKHKELEESFRRLGRLKSQLAKMKPLDSVRSKKLVNLAEKVGEELADWRDNGR